METVCQLSYPLNSENASPFGTRTVYLAWPVSCAEVALLPRTASTERASDSTTITTAGILLLFIASPRCLLVASMGLTVRRRLEVPEKRRSLFMVVTVRGVWHAGPERSNVTRLLRSGAAFVFRLLQCRYRQVSDVHERGEAWHRQRSTSQAQAAGIRVPPLHRRLR